MAAGSDHSYKTVLAHIGNNLETGDVASAKFIIGENNMLFPARELETVNTGLELMALLEKKGFVSETNVTDLYTLLKQIKCSSLCAELNPLKNKLTLCKDAKWKVGYTRVPHFLKVKGCTLLAEILTTQNRVVLIGK
ncbi:hypothetical protein KP79_PYT08099 [Mizuhopecten yessoensis]|uniref:DED domain-containing protein n=1 Tax=Mizuhopecten yessoensis TaxID=6573 RepID=A0A210PRK6_MIZYE|nr:hypothetical protein KP79_PYT08099 [Mizuhopecten yessoensis]